MDCQPSGCVSEFGTRPQFAKGFMFAPTCTYVYMLCEWEGEQSDSWVWHDKMASVGYVGDLANTIHMGADM